MECILLTLLASQQPLDAFDEFVSVTVSVDANLFKLLVAHVCQNIQRNLHGNSKYILDYISLDFTVKTWRKCNKYSILHLMIMVQSNVLN